MMIRLLMLASMFVSMYSTAVHACSCSVLGEDFFETVFLHNQKVNNGSFPKTMALTVVTAEVTDHLQLRRGPKPTEMVLDIVDIIQGDAISKKLVVLGDDGMSCMPYVTDFAKGKKFIFALNQYEGQFYISSCGVYSKELPVR